MHVSPFGSGKSDVEEGAGERCEILFPAVLQTHLVAPGSEPVSRVSDEETDLARPGDWVQFVNLRSSVSHVDLVTRYFKAISTHYFHVWGWEKLRFGPHTLCPGVKQIECVKVALSL